MAIIIILIAISISVAFIFATIFYWNKKSGQYGDMYTPSVKVGFESKQPGKIERPPALKRKRTAPQVAGHQASGDGQADKLSPPTKIDYRGPRDRNSPAGRMVFENKTPNLSSGTSDRNRPVQNIC